MVQHLNLRKNLQGFVFREGSGEGTVANAMNANEKPVHLRDGELRVEAQRESITAIPFLSLHAEFRYVTIHSRKVVPLIGLTITKKCMRVMANHLPHKTNKQTIVHHFVPVMPHN